MWPEVQAGDLVKTLIFVTEDGETAIEADESGSVMQAAKAHGVPGIDADCGGSMVCGTCHVYVLDGLRERLPAPSEMESEMLEYVPDPHPEARLSCQLQVIDCADGMRFEVPPAQR